MGTKDMTVKEKVLRMVERLPGDVTYDRIIYHLEVMKEIEIGLAEAERGELIDHDVVFAELLAEDGKNQDLDDAPGKAKPATNPKAHRSGRAANGSRLHKGTQKRGRKTKRPS